MSRDVTGCHGLSREIHGQRGCYSCRHITVHNEKKVTNHFELIFDNNLILKVSKKTLKASKFNTKKNHLHPNEIEIKTYL